MSGIYSIGAKLRETREDQGMTRTDLEKKSGVSRSYIKRVELETASPSLDVVDKLAQALDLDFYELLDCRAAKMEKDADEEYDRLTEVFKDIPSDKKDIAEGLIIQASRLRALLNDNWQDILKNGEYEKFQQSKDVPGYDRKRPIVENYDNRDKTYKEIIQQLYNMLPRQEVQVEDKTESKRHRLTGRD